jgi:hypothetical protein
MSISQLAITNDIETTKVDTLGGEYIKPTGLIHCIVDMAYLSKSSTGAMSLNLHLRNAEDKSITRHTLWITSGDKKGNKNYYINKNGKKFLLPDMVKADQISKITAGKPMSELTAENKTIKLWDFNASAEKPTEVPALPEMIGQPLMVGLIKCRDNKRVNDGSGNYVPTRDERFSNEIDKVFHPNRFTVTEKEAGAEEAKFANQWEEKYDSEYVRDNYDPNVEDPTDDSLPEPEVAKTAELFS